MPHRIKKKRSLFAPLADNFINRLSASDSRFRRKLVKISFWVVGAIFCYTLMSGNYGIPRIIRLEMQKHSLIEANQRLTADLIDAGRIRKLLEKDPSYIEYIARTKYRMVRPNETIYRYRGQ